MGTWSDNALSLTPDAYFRLDDASNSLVDATGNLANGTYQAGFNLSQTKADAVDDGTSVQFLGFSSGATSPSNSILSGVPAFTISTFLQTTDTQSRQAFTFGANTTDQIVLRQSAVGRFQGRITIGNDRLDYGMDAAVDFSAFKMLTWVFDSGISKIYIDGVEVAGTITDSAPHTSTPVVSGSLIVSNNSFYDAGLACLQDEFLVWTRALSDLEVASLFAGGTPPDPNTLPVTLYGQVESAGSTLPTRLQGLSSIPASNLPVLLEAPDPAHYTAAAARWSAAVRLNGLDKTSDLTGEVTIEHSETASGLATFQIIPPPGIIDLSDYERKPVEIDFIGNDADGTILYTVRQFTGITTMADYDPDEGVITVECTTDLQGRLEQLPRDVIDTIVGGLWSEHVFDDNADGWTYAQNRLSTRPSEIHVDNYGQLVVVDWAAGTPARTFTDAGRFAQSLELDRVSRRELVTRVRVNFEFRYQRLRHREIGVTLVNSIGLCGWLNGEGRLPSKGTVTSGATSGQWTRVSDILFTELPDTPQAGICGGTNFIPSDASRQLCLGASWTAARRWAQTVTETYALDLIAPDMEEAIGQQQTNLDYGIAASFDSSDFERIREYDGPPTGSELKSESGDWQLEATDAERTGRAALEVAQECAMEVAKTIILDRARQNRVAFDCTYDPSLTLADTIRIDTPHLTATGKIAQLTESLDTETGGVDLTLRLAISRHGGSGLAVDDPIIAPPEPDQPQEQITARQYNMQYRLGGTLFSAPESEDWDGWITNAFGAARTDPTNLYRERLVVIMPEIEEAARDSTVIQAPADYEVAVPEDELTLSN